MAFVFLLLDVLPREYLSELPLPSDTLSTCWDWLGFDAVQKDTDSFKCKTQRKELSSFLFQVTAEVEARNTRDYQRQEGYVMWIQGGCLMGGWCLLVVAWKLQFSWKQAAESAG